MATLSADVQTETAGSRPESKLKSSDCSKDEMMDEVEIERICASRGDYEVEFSSNGEGGLHQRRKKCNKNPGHLKFFPVKDFNIKHLPSRYRDNLLVDYVRATSDITCRLSVSCISGDRPDTWPDSGQPFPFSAYKGKNFTMTGTGWVRRVNKESENSDYDCECDDCCGPGKTPKKTWGEVYIQTALHVVSNNEEAIHTKCQFFYDSNETDINCSPTLTGPKVFESNIKGDTCLMKYVTHDVEVVDKFLQIWKHWDDLHQRVIKKYESMRSPNFRVPGVECDTNVDHDLCIIVSHPHGCSKVVTIGAWTHKSLIGTNMFGAKEIKFSYNTPTCPGSSGAAVITLEGIGTNSVIFNPPPHSQGCAGNINESGEGLEWFKRNNDLMLGLP